MEQITREALSILSDKEILLDYFTVALRKDRFNVPMSKRGPRGRACHLRVVYHCH
jgi:hypothetical protein